MAIDDRSTASMGTFFFGVSGRNSNTGLILPRPAMVVFCANITVLPN